MKHYFKYTLRPFLRFDFIHIYIENIYFIDLNDKGILINIKPLRLTQYIYSI